ncbi:FAD-dependent monooxygenase [Actinomycetospora endophytica]|uniref:FAD-dependent monooxygenase n=1 Tax=Actinomycetospora endophytica TaxID=2291215 RepID=A0ABS8PDU8_9PSEU|nr:NAD(P)/FAD-dependent oxidoreductase [Actinomycetospora endophytica]MCD2196339.1 FAD-dependent monooxygenase [Actinomycetospora endophytica]
MTDSPLRVLIIGAGIGGLALGQALVASGGVDVRIHERNPDAAAWLDGYRLNINPDGARALHRCLPIGLWEAFTATSPTPPGGISFRTEHLRELFTITRDDMTGGSTDPADGQYGVSRRVLRTLLLAGLDDHIRYGAEFERYSVEPDGTVTAHFTDGSTATGDVLVGADGANSAVRRQYLPHAERVPSDAGGFAARLPLDDETRAWLPAALTEGMTLVMPPSGRASMFTSAFPGRDALTAAISDGVGLAGLGLDADTLLDDTDDYVLWSVIADHRALPDDGQDGPTLQARALDMVRGWSPALRRMITETDPASIAVMRFRQSTLVEPWPSATVTVLGDAIHNMPPVGGLGANSALRDAAELADRLLAARDGAPLVPAIAAYEERMRGWGYGAVRESTRNARQATTANPVARRISRGYFRTRSALRRRHSRPQAVTTAPRR